MKTSHRFKASPLLPRHLDELVDDPFRPLPQHDPTQRPDPHDPRDDHKRRHIIDTSKIADKREKISDSLTPLADLPARQRTKAETFVRAMVVNALKGAAEAGLLAKLKVETQDKKKDVVVWIHRKETKVAAFDLPRWEDMHPHDRVCDLKVDIFFRNADALTLLPVKVEHRDDTTAASLSQHLHEALLRHAAPTRQEATRHDCVCKLSGLTQRLSRKNAGIQTSGKPITKARQIKPTSCAAQCKVSVFKAKNVLAAATDDDDLGAAIERILKKSSHFLRLRFSNFHNHPAHDVHLRRALPVAAEDYIMSLFSENVSEPVVVRRLLEKKGEELWGSTFTVNDLPKADKIRKLFLEYLSEKWGVQDTLDNVPRMKEYAAAFNKDDGIKGGKLILKEPGFWEERNYSAALAPSEGDKKKGWCIAATTSLSSSVHEWVQQAGETVFVDGTHNLVAQDKDAKLIWLLCGSPVGGLPLGYIITNMNSEMGYRACFEALVETLPPHAFFHRGPKKGMCIWLDS